MRNNHAEYPDPHDEERSAQFKQVLSGEITAIEEGRS